MMRWVARRVKGFPVRKLPALLSIIVLALLLVACGSDDEESAPTAAPVVPTQAAAETEPAIATSESTSDAGPATPGSLIASPFVSATPIASPVAGGTPIAVASPVVGATPVVVASPVTSGTSGAGFDAMAVPGAAGNPVPGVQALYGTVTLPGTINEGFVIADDGCVGLGRYAGVEAGQQVIVRDGQGNIIGVTELAATESSVVCSWTFEAEVPESGYYAVSIPTVGERVYAGEDVAASDGRIELELP